MVIFQWAVLAFAAAVLQLTLKKEQPAFAFLVSACAAAGLLGAVAGQVRPLLVWLQGLEAYFPGEGIRCLVRVLGIALCAQLAADFCKDAGMTAAAGAAELCGRLLALLEALPLLQGLVDSFLSFLS